MKFNFLAGKGTRRDEVQGVTQLEVMPGIFLKCFAVLLLKKLETEAVVMMDFIKKGLAFGLGLAVTSKEQAEKFVNELVKKGELSQEESKDMINQLIQRGEEEKKEIKRIMREQLKQMMDELNLATKDDINRLEQRIQNLEKRDE